MMARNKSARGLLFALIWFAAGLAILYAAALIAEQPNMRLFCLVWAGTWPPCCGFYVGWLDEGAGFGAGARALFLPVLFLAAAWWWLVPELWDGVLCAKAALYALTASSFCGGAGAGFQKARQKLHPPPEDNDEQIE